MAKKVKEKREEIGINTELQMIARGYGRQPDTI
jgi:hypothetical protein